MIQLCSTDCTARTIAQLLDIVQALNERMDAIESTTRLSQAPKVQIEPVLGLLNRYVDTKKEPQNEHKPTNT